MVNWDDILTAKEASFMLGRNEKYIYMLFKMHSPMILQGSVTIKGNTMLISREGFEHLKEQIEQMEVLKKKANLDDNPIKAKQSNLQEAFSF